MNRIFQVFIALLILSYPSGSAGGDVAVFDLTVNQDVSGASPFSLLRNPNNWPIGDDYTLKETDNLGPYWAVQVVEAMPGNGVTGADLGNTGTTVYLYRKSSFVDSAAAWSNIEKNYILYNIPYDDPRFSNPILIPAAIGNNVRFNLETNGVTPWPTFKIRVTTGQEGPSDDPGWISSAYLAFTTTGVTIYESGTTPAMDPPDGTRWVAMGPSGDTIYVCFDGIYTAPAVNTGQMIISGGELIIPVNQYRRSAWTVDGTHAGTIKLDWYSRRPF